MLQKAILLGYIANDDLDELIKELELNYDWLRKVLPIELIFSISRRRENVEKENAHKLTNYYLLWFVIKVLNYLSMN